MERVRGQRSEPSATEDPVRLDGYFDSIEMDLGVIQEDDDGNAIRTNTKVVLPLDPAAAEDRWKVERFIKRKWWEKFRAEFEKEWEQQMEARR